MSASPETGLQANGVKMVKQFIEGMNKLLYPEPEEAAVERQRQLIARQPDSVYEATIKADVIDMNKVRQLAFRGIPNDFRGIYWKLLLGYLPPDRSQWEQQLINRRHGYKTLLATVLADPKSNGETDHPLSTEADSAWKIHFQDLDTQEIIQRDVARTMPELKFFCSADKTNTVHGTALNNMLFLYAKSNKKIGYVQGMNEVLAQIYYVFATSKNEDERDHAEEDAFSCFAMLMGEISDTFNKELDSAMLDSFNTIGRFQALLAILDPNLYLNMKSKNLDPRFYALRWMSLLFSQEYDVPDVQRLWDSLFADDNRFTFLLFFACSLVISVRSQLISNDFSRDLMVLQNLAVPNMDEAIYRAEQLMVNTDPQKLQPSYMKQFMDELNKCSMTGEDMLARDDEALKLEIQKHQMKAAASRKKAAAAAAAATDSSADSSKPAETASTTTEQPNSRQDSTSAASGTPTAAVQAKPITRERKPSVPGALPEQFCTMPWHG